MPPPQQLDLTLFSNIASITSLDGLPEIGLIWQQYDIQECAGPPVSHGGRGAGRSDPNPGATADVLARAAANCLRLLMVQPLLQPQEPQPQETAPDSADAPQDFEWRMPSAPKTATVVRMTIHIFARFMDDWVRSLQRSGVRV